MLPIYSQESNFPCETWIRDDNDTYINRIDEGGRKSRVRTGKPTNQNQKVLTFLHQQRTILSFQPVRHFGHLRKYPMQDLSMFVQVGPAAVIKCHHVPPSLLVIDSTILSYFYYLNSVGPFHIYLFNGLAPDPILRPGP